MGPPPAERFATLTLDVIVIGAGQAGLATGYFLQQTGVRYGLFDYVGRIGDSWRRRYDSLVLFSPRAYSSLPGVALNGDPDGYADKDEIAGYLEHYAQAVRLPVFMGEGIARLELQRDRFFGLTTRGRQVVSRAVVVATGAFGRSAVPSFAASLPAGVTQLRAGAYHNPRQLPTGSVLVVGGGATGRQIASELAGSHRVSLSTGRSVTITPQRMFGQDVMVWFDRFGCLRADKATAVGRFVRTHESFPGLHLRDTALRRRGVHLRPRAVGATSDGCAFADGTADTFDVVIWAAGYQDNASWLSLPTAVHPNGSYVENRGASPVPGLYYVGRSWQTSRASALLCGVGTDAARIVRQLTAWLRHDVPVPHWTRTPEANDRLGATA